MRSEVSGCALAGFAVKVICYGYGVRPRGHRREMPRRTLTNEKAAISGGLVTAQQEVLKSVRLSPRKVRSRSSFPYPPDTPATAIGAARIPPRRPQMFRKPEGFFES
jgi:hypothetical protein